ERLGACETFERSRTVREGRARGRETKRRLDLRRKDVTLDEIASARTAERRRLDVSLAGDPERVATRREIGEGRGIRGAVAFLGERDEAKERRAFVGLEGALERAGLMLGGALLRLEQERLDVLVPGDREGEAERAHEERQRKDPGDRDDEEAVADRAPAEPGEPCAPGRLQLGFLDAVVSIHGGRILALVSCERQCTKADRKPFVGTCRAEDDLVHLPRPEPACSARPEARANRRRPRELRATAVRARARRGRPGPCWS